MQSKNLRLDVPPGQLVLQKTVSMEQRGIESADTPSAAVCLLLPQLLQLASRDPMWLLRLSLQSTQQELAQRATFQDPPLAVDLATQVRTELLALQASARSMSCRVHRDCVAATHEVNAR